MFVVGLLLIIAIIFFVIYYFYNKDQTKQIETPIIPEEATNNNLNLESQDELKNDNLKIAKSILNFLWTQRNSLNLYSSFSTCEDPNNLQTCTPADDSWRWSIPVIWARFKYYQATDDQEELMRLQSDLRNMVNNVINSDERFLQTSSYNCAMMKEIANSSLINDEIRSLAAKVCFLADYESQAMINPEPTSSSLIENDLNDLVNRLNEFQYDSNSVVTNAYGSAQTANFYASLDQINKLNFPQLSQYVTKTDIIIEMQILMNYLFKIGFQNPQQFSPLEKCLFQQSIKQYLNFNPTLSNRIPANFFQDTANFNLEINQILDCSFAHYLNQVLNKNYLQNILRSLIAENGLISNNEAVSTNANALAAGFLTILE